MGGHDGHHSFALDDAALESATTDQISARILSQALDRNALNTPLIDPSLTPDEVQWPVPDFLPIASSRFFASLGPDERTMLGRQLVAAHMEMGISFERNLMAGLLHWVKSDGPLSPTVQFLLQETAEEALHSRVFSTCAAWALDGTGLADTGYRFDRDVSEMLLGSTETLLLTALGGEEPIDYIQRRTLREVPVCDPLRAIFKFHIADEARHIAFARQMLAARVSQLDRRHMRTLQLTAPALVIGAAHEMCHVGPTVARLWGVPPDDVVDEGYRAAYSALIDAAVARTKSLLHQLQIHTTGVESLWQRMAVTFAEGGTA